ncbi:hypothetical protein [Roseococcus sp. YIM B11640]|uniref:hypothetical protein n=1 Tax=Roseococcus sp. YIM B11640 TaxID=3133973 RepID=UPI003C7C8F4F
MLRRLAVIGLLISGPAVAAPVYDIRSNPTGVSGTHAPHVVGNDNGRPIIHRPENNALNSTANGVAFMPAGDVDRSIRYSGRGRGTVGSERSPRIVTNDDGRPQLSYSR